MDIYNKAKNDEEREYYQHMADEDFRDNVRDLKDPRKVFDDYNDFEQAMKHRETKALYDFAAFRLNNKKTISSNNGHKDVNEKLLEIKGLNWQIISEEQYEQIYENKKYVNNRQQSSPYSKVLSSFEVINSKHDISADPKPMPKDQLIADKSLELITAGYPDWSKDDMAIFDYKFDYSGDRSQKVDCMKLLRKELAKVE